MIVLVDMDDVLTDYNTEATRIWRREYPHDQQVPRLSHPDFTSANTKLWEKYCSIILRQYFFQDLPPIEGGVEAVQEMLRLRIDVFICTAPLISSDFCLQEKRLWVMQYLGPEWRRRMIIASDKTLVHGDFLIDDNLKRITGARKRPSWKHVIFDRDFNRHIRNRRRISWSNWREVLGV